MFVACTDKKLNLKRVPLPTKKQELELEQYEAAAKPAMAALQNNLQSALQATLQRIAAHVMNAFICIWIVPCLCPGTGARGNARATEPPRALASQDP